MSKAKAPLKFEQSDSGIVAISGNCKFFMINNWYEADDTGFLTDKCRLDVMKTIQQKLLDGEFKNVKPEQQSIVILGEAIMCFQKSNSRMKILTPDQCVQASGQIMHAFFEQAKKDGFFDDIDVQALSDRIKKDEEEELAKILAKDEENNSDDEGSGS